MHLTHLIYTFVNVTEEAELRFVDEREERAFDETLRLSKRINPALIVLPDLMAMYARWAGEETWKLKVFPLVELEYFHPS